MYIIKQLPEDFIVEEIPSFSLNDLNENHQYTYFLLEKKEYDTEKIIQKLSHYFNIKRKNFGYAGSKDKYAITKQYCSVKGKIKEIENNEFKVKIIGNGNKPLSLGDLKGNKFTIKVRSLEKEQNPKPTDNIINYFDEQRFGKHNLEIGLAILKKDFKKAAELIDLDNVKNHLSSTKNDYVGALKKVPFKILNIYLHSVQSWLWNEVASEYIKIKSKKNTSIKYSKGIFIFPEKRIKNIAIPLLSFDTEFENNKIKGIYEDILSKKKILLRDFIIRQIPDITPMGGKRQLIVEVKNLEICKKEEDELNEGKKKIKISFELGKGSYATILIKKIFKNKN